jgi:hypothetical protein
MLDCVIQVNLQKLLVVLIKRRVIVNKLSKDVSDQFGFLFPALYHVHEFLGIEIRAVDIDSN